MTPETNFVKMLMFDEPQAIAWVKGDGVASKLNGHVKFFETPYQGVLVEAEFFGLPNFSVPNSSDFYAMHIHEFGDCSPPFDKTGNHFNPTNMLHPYHAGDLIPLLGNQGYAYSACFTKRFVINEIIGKSVIIHSKADDFTTQPSGNAGTKIGCGIIESLMRV